MRLSRKNKSDKILKESLSLKLMRNSSVGMVAFLATFVSFSALSPIEPTSAEEILFATQATGGVVSLTSSGNVNLSMYASSAGTVQTAVDAVQVTSGNAGYQLYLSVAGDNNALIRDGGSSSNEADTIPAGGGSNILNPTVLGTNTWGFAVASKDTTSGFGSEDVLANGFDNTYPTGDNSVMTSKFAKVPTKGNDVKIASRSGSANNVLTNVYYGVKANTAKPSGLYKNTVTYTAIGDGTTSGLASISPDRTNQLGGGVTFTIATPSTTALSSIGTVAVTVGGQTCTNPQVTKSDNGTGALNNVTCTSPALSTGWHEVIVNFAGSSETYVVNPGIEYYLDEGGSQVATYMQDFTVADCANMASLSSLTLQDNRDNNIYRITKQADGNCWMTENLRLGNTSDNSGIISQDIVLNSSNSDIPTNLKASNSTDPYTFTIAADKMQTNTFVPEGYDTNWNDSNWDKQRIYSFTADPDSTTSAVNKRAYGNLYNWYTATAGSGTRTGVTSGADAPASICPKGWKLPPNTGDGSYTNLMRSQIPDVPITGFDITYTNAFQQTPLSFVLSGYYFTTNEGQGEGGHYWSRTSHSSNNDIARYFYFGGISGKIELQNDNTGKLYGFSVRCVFMSTMQNFSSLACSNLKTAQTITLKDTRDLNEYSVAKMADGNCWMTSNLRLGSASADTVLTPADTNITFNYTIPSSAVLTSSDPAMDWSSTPFTNHMYIIDNAAYGNLYNFYTTTAGTYSAEAANSEMTNSICPRGWVLPSANDYTNFLSAAGNPTTSQLLSSPYNFTLAGGYDINNDDGYGYTDWSWYYTRTVNTAINAAKRFAFSSGGEPHIQDFGEIGNLATYNGFSVRCIFTP